MSDKELRGVLEELAGEGRRDSGGVFSLDWRKAREKLQKFQLLDLHRWVLHGVMGALAGGATAVNVRTDADDCVLTFDGPPLEAEQLEQLFAHLLAEKGDDRARELALAVYAAAALKPARLQLDTGSSRLSLQGSELEVTPLATPGELNELSVRARVSWRVVRQLMTGQTPEADLLKQACGQAPVWLNGQTLLEPWEPVAPLTVQAGCLEMKPGALHRTVPPEGCRGAGLALWEDGPAEGVIRVLRYGVLTSEKRVSLGGHRVMALVDAPALRMNVSQSDVLEDERFEALVGWLRTQVREALTALARSRDLSEEQASLLRQVAAREVAFPCQDDFERALAEAPVWQDHAGRPAALPEQVYVTRSNWEHPPVRGQRVLQWHPLLEPIYPELADGDHLLREAQSAHDRRRAWEQGAPGPVTLHGFYLHVHDFVGGQIGFREDPTRPTVLFPHKAGRVLGPMTGVEELPTGLEIAVNRDDFNPDPTWTRPERDAAWKLMLDHLPLEAAYARVDSRAHRLNFLRWRLAREDARPLVPGIENAPLFATLDGNRLSLAQLRQEERIPFLSEPPPGGLREPFAGTLLLTTDEWAVLAHFLGEDRLEDQREELEPLLRERTFLERPELDPLQLPPGISRVDIQGGRLVLEGRAPACRFVVEALYRGRLLERMELDPPSFGSVFGRVEVEGRARPGPYFDRVGRGRAELVRWLNAQLARLAVCYCADYPGGPALLEYFCGVLPEDWKETQDELVRSICSLPLLTGDLSLDDLAERLAERSPPELRQREKLLLTKLVGRAALEQPKAEEVEVVEPGSLPTLSEGYELAMALPAPWNGQLGLTRRKSSKIRVKGRKSATKRCPVGFQISLVEAPEGTDWHRQLLDLVCMVAREHAAEHPDYLLYLLERELDGLDAIPVRGDVLGRPYALGDLLAVPVQYLEAGQRAPAAHPEGPLYRLTESQVKQWGKFFALVKFVPPLTRLEELYPGREWLVRVRLEPPLEGELGVPLEGEAGELRILGPGGWSSRPLPDHRGLVGVVRGEVPNLLELLPLERVESELAALDREDPAYRKRVSGWRDWRTAGLGLSGSPLSPPSPAPQQEGSPLPHEVEVPPMSEYQRLSVALKEQMARILGGDPELLKALPADITFGVTPKGAFCHCTPDGRVILDEKHPLVARLLKADSPEDEYFYFLVSAVFSVINRARADIKDEHERAFHARLLAHLLKEDG